METDAASSILHFVSQRRKSKADHGRLQSHNTHYAANTNDTFQPYMSPFAPSQEQVAVDVRYRGSSDVNRRHENHQSYTSIFDTDAESIDDSHTLGDETKVIDQATRSIDAGFGDHALHRSMSIPTSAEKKADISSDAVAMQKGGAFPSSTSTFGSFDPSRQPKQADPDQPSLHDPLPVSETELRVSSAIQTGGRHSPLQIREKMRNGQARMRLQKTSEHASTSFNAEKRISSTRVGKIGPEIASSQSKSGALTVNQQPFRAEKADLPRSVFKVGSTIEMHKESEPTTLQDSHFRAFSSPEGTDDESCEGIPKEQHMQRHSHKRSRSLDYPMHSLKTMEYGFLRDQPFDHDPSSPNHNLPAELCGGASNTSLNHLFHAKEQRRAADQRTTYFNSLTMSEHEECGDLIIDEFRKLLEKLKKLRREKRGVCEEYEASIGSRHTLVSEKRIALEAGLRAMQSRGKSIISRSGDDATS